MQIINNTNNVKALTEKSRQEYAATLYAASALAHITMNITNDAIDELEEKCGHLIKFKIKHSVLIIRKSIERLQKAIREQMKGKTEYAWMCDFGNMAQKKIEPHIINLHYAISNFLGKYPKVTDRHIFASIIIAQSIASEAKTYVDNASKKFIQYNVVGKDGRKHSAQAVIQTISCAEIRHHLTVIADALLGPCLPNDINILDGPEIYNGCKAIINCLINPKTWAEALTKAEQLNNLKIK